MSIIPFPPNPHQEEIRSLQQKLTHPQQIIYFSHCSHIHVTSVAIVEKQLTARLETKFGYIYMCPTYLGVSYSWLLITPDIMVHRNLLNLCCSQSFHVKLWSLFYLLLLKSFGKTFRKFVCKKYLCINNA